MSKTKPTIQNDAPPGEDASSSAQSVSDIRSRTPHPSAHPPPPPHPPPPFDPNELISALACSEPFPMLSPGAGPTPSPGGPHSAPLSVETAPLSPHFAVGDEPQSAIHSFLPTEATEDSPATSSAHHPSGLSPSPPPPTPGPPLPPEPPSGKFPLFPDGRCPHREHWTRVRGKRAYAYYFCGYCGLGWRALRPKGPLPKLPEAPTPSVTSHSPSPGDPPACGAGKG